ncbi:hypothetical protein Fmac_011576 [Flemingia macrophylla]|uniref:Uncharacterized protein n=1 Tax=Flemingia macrophylla TaxID=520843 RepID=A0ABD1MPX4_9FABA
MQRYPMLRSPWPSCLLFKFEPNVSKNLTSNFENISCHSTKGQILSIEAILAIQTLKCLHLTNPRNLADMESNTLMRLIKFDLVATLWELLRQQECALALRFFSTLRSEYSEADYSLYAKIV